MHPKFPMYIWDELLPQTFITFNLLRTSRTCPKISAYTYLHGTYNFDTTPLAPPDVRALPYYDPTIALMPLNVQSSRSKIILWQDYRLCTQNSLCIYGMNYSHKHSLPSTYYKHPGRVPKFLRMPIYMARIILTQLH